jgi:hypothetical protein
MVCYICHCRFSQLEEERYRRSSGRPEGGVAFQILMPRG